MTAFFLVLQFQNCAPVQPGARAQANDDPDASSPVYAINFPTSPGSLAFEKQTVEVATLASNATVNARCSSTISDAVLQWKLLDPKGGPHIIEGVAECLNGELKIDITPAQMLACNSIYKLAVATSDRSAQSINLQRFCP